MTQKRGSCTPRAIMRLVKQYGNVLWDQARDADNLSGAEFMAAYKRSDALLGRDPPSPYAERGGEMSRTLKIILPLHGCPVHSDGSDHCWHTEAQ